MSDLLELSNMEAGLDNPESPINNVFTALRSILKGHLDGLRLEYVSGSSVKVKKGVAALESGGLVNTSADITKSSLSLSNSTWYHLYLFVNAGVADIEVSTTAPATPYFGTARSKTGDTSRRYVGSVKTNSSGAIFKFTHINNQIRYLENTLATPFYVIVAGQATSETTISAAGAVPVTSRLAICRAANSASIEVNFGTLDDNLSLATGVFLDSVGPIPNDTELMMLLDTSQQFTYRYASSPGAGATFVSVKGYFFER
jgi:hypothetical protein